MKLKSAHYKFLGSAARNICFVGRVYIDTKQWISQVTQRPGAKLKITETCNNQDVLF